MVEKDEELEKTPEELDDGKNRKLKEFTND